MTVIRGSNSSASLAAMLVVPEAFTRLERFVAARAAVRARVRVGSFVSADRREVFEAFTALSTGVVQLTRSVLEKNVFLEMVALLEADHTRQTDVRTLV